MILDDRPLRRRRSGRAAGSQIVSLRFLGFGCAFALHGRLIYGIRMEVSDLRVSLRSPAYVNSKSRLQLVPSYQSHACTPSARRRSLQSLVEAVNGLKLDPGRGHTFWCKGQTQPPSDWSEPSLGKIEHGCSSVPPSNSQLSTRSKDPDKSIEFE